MRRARAFTILEVMVSIAILALLASALMAFSFGLGDRRDRLMREGERGAMLARVVDRLERAASTARRAAGTGERWLEVSGRGVWPTGGQPGVPTGPVGFTGRLEFVPDSGELVWRETSEDGEELMLIVPGVEAVLVDRFDDLVTASSGRPPVRVSIWLAGLGEPAPTAAAAADADEPQDITTLDDLALEQDEALPQRAADVVLVVADPAGERS